MPKKQKKQLRSFADIQRNFLLNLDSIDFFVRQLTPVVKDKDKEQLGHLKNNLSEVLKLLKLPSKDKNKKTKITHKFKLSSEQLDHLSGLLEKTKDFSPHNQEILYKSAFVLLISYLDFLISDLIHFYYRKYTDSLSKEMSLSLNDLKQCPNIEAAIACLINREVEKVMFKSIEDQRIYFQNTLKIDCDDLNWAEVIEPIGRRNIVVHNNSVVNKLYLDKSRVYFETNKIVPPKEGSRVNIDEKYFHAVFQNILILGILLIQICWRKWDAAEIANADDNFNSVVFDCLQNKNYYCAERLGFFSSKFKTSSKQFRLFFDINYYQSLKWQNKKKMLEESLAKFDVSELSPVYSLAFHALKVIR